MIAVSPQTHYELYHDWQKALAFCRSIPDVPPRRPTTFHMYWRQKRSGLFRKARPFGRKQALPVKAFFATQDPATSTLTLWSDEDLSGNLWLEPFAERIAFRVYTPAAEARGTALEARPDLLGAADHRVWRDGDLFRILALHEYGGVYVDMDMVLLRSLGALLDQEFVYQWERFDHMFNGAIMHAAAGSVFTRELIDGVIALPPGNFNWGRENLRRAIDRGAPVTIFPAVFFDAEWHADSIDGPFKRTPASTRTYDGAFAWHWHNRWDQRIEEGSKFQLLEAAMDARLRENGFRPGPPVTRDE